MSYYTTCGKCGASLDPGEKCDCVQTKEKSTETAATVNGANLNNHNQDITNPTKKQPFKISEYLKYCDCVGKQPNQFVIEQLDIYLKSPRSKPRNREENEAEAIQKIKLLSPFERAAIIEIMEFFVWKNQRKKSHIAAIPPG